LPQAPLFTRPDGTLLRSWHIEWSWRQARAKAHLPNAHFHDLRHTGLTLTAQLGATQAELMRRAGHSTPQAAQVYQHAADSRDHLIAQRLSALGVAATQTG
jgi:integrase